MNEQKPLAADYAMTGRVDVHSVFKTVQGEGPYCGERALFIRLFGCNLRCPSCDTEYTATRRVMEPYEILQCVRAHAWPQGALIVITGGEPFRQNIVPSIRVLLDAGYKVQVETNGTMRPINFSVLHNYPLFSIVCSPKTSHIHASVAEKVSAYKYVLRAGEIEDDGLPTRALGHAANPHVARPPHKNVPIYVQPLDEGDGELNAANTAATVESCMRHGYTLQIQIHKILDLP